ncbi:MAG: hypothetical protein LBR26_13210 [Prevotella sp.]|jgi:hypothetical protein|nr:hypothetical protein [Prevotella sp.]
MKKEEIKLTRIVAGNGYVLASKDKSQVFGSVIYLGINDSADNYIEIPVDEAENVNT